MFSRACLPFHFFPRLLPTKGFLAPANHLFVFPRLLSMLYFFEFWLVDYADFLQLHLIDLSRVVREPVNANPGLKVNRSIHFYCLNILFGVYVLFWALFNSFSYCKEETSHKSYKTEIEIPYNPGLAKVTQSWVIV